MQIITFAAIDVGSYATEMKIYELSGQYGMKEIDCIQSSRRNGEKYSFFYSPAHIIMSAAALTFSEIPSSPLFTLESRLKTS